MFISFILWHKENNLPSLFFVVSWKNSLSVMTEKKIIGVIFYIISFLIASGTKIRSLLSGCYYWSQCVPFSWLSFMTLYELFFSTNHGILWNPVCSHSFLSKQVSFYRRLYSWCSVLFFFLLLDCLFLAITPLNHYAGRSLNI